MRRWREEIPHKETAIEKDQNSLSNVDAFSTSHLSFDLEADFEKKIFRGSVTLTLHFKKDTEKAVLDTRDLKVEGASEDGRQVEFKLEEEHRVFGRALSLHFSAKKGETRKITISYSTSPDAVGLQWLSPQQTEGKKHPYLFCKNFFSFF